MAARIDKAAFTRADMVELIGAQLPVDAPGDARGVIEQIVDAVGVRVSAPRGAHEREGHEKYTLDVIMAEEPRIFDLVDQRNPVAVGCALEDVQALSPDQAARRGKHRGSPFLVQPLSAPAGAGKTTAIRALRAAATAAPQHLLVLAPTGKAVDEALRDGAGDRGFTVAKALELLRGNHRARSAHRGGR